MLRFTHWARAFEVNSADASNELALRNTAPPDRLGQHPYRSPSVFNFYRPGYIAPGTSTGNAGLTAPELQIVNASSIVGYANFLSAYLLGATPQVDRNAPRSFVSDYDAEVALEEDVGALLDHLDLLLTHGELQAETRARITDALDVIPAANAEDRQNRVRLAILMVMTSPEYIVLR